MPLLAGQVPGRGQPGQRLALGFTLWGWDEAPCVMLCRAGRVARHLAVGWLAVAAKAASGEGISAGLSRLSSAGAREVAQIPSGLGSRLGAGFGARDATDPHPSARAWCKSLSGGDWQSCDGGGESVVWD